MSLAITVSVPADTNAIFPNRCVWCGKQEPAATVTVHAHVARGWLGLFSPHVYFSGWRKIHAPICYFCKPFFLFQRYGRTLAILVITLAIIAFADRGLHVPRLLLKLVVFALLIPVIALEVFYPRRFDIDASSNTISYNFTSRDYAEEFAALNDGSSIE